MTGAQWQRTGPADHPTLPRGTEGPFAGWEKRRNIYTGAAEYKLAVVGIWIDPANAQKTWGNMRHRRNGNNGYLDPQALGEGARRQVEVGGSERDTLVPPDRDLPQSHMGWKPIFSSGFHFGGETLLIFQNEKDYLDHPSRRGGGGNPNHP